MKVQIERGALMVLLTVLVACSSIGLAPAQNLEQRIAYSYGQVTAVRSAAAVALENRRLGVDEAKAVLEITNQARGILDGSKAALGAGDIQTAEGRLSLAVSLLAALQTRLNNQSPRATT